MEQHLYRSHLHFQINGTFSPQNGILSIETLLENTPFDNGPGSNGLTDLKMRVRKYLDCAVSHTLSLSLCCMDKSKVVSLFNTWILAPYSPKVQIPQDNRGPHAFRLSGYIAVRDLTDSPFGSIACPGLSTHTEGKRCFGREEGKALTALEMATLFYFTPLSICTGLDMMHI